MAATCIIVARARISKHSSRPSSSHQAQTIAIHQHEWSDPTLGQNNAIKRDLQWAWASRPQLSGKKEDEWTQGGDRSCVTVDQEKVFRRWSSWTSDHWGDFARGPQEVGIRKQDIQNSLSSREMETKDQQHHRRWASNRAVEKGLLIFPGSHASLDQLDDDSKHIHDVSYQAGEKITTPQNGSKWRVLQWAVKMRKEHPELISKIDTWQNQHQTVMPIIVSRIVQQQMNGEPASLFIRDSFSASFADEARSVQVLGNQASRNPGQAHSAHPGHWYWLWKIIQEQIWKSALMNTGDIRGVAQQRSNWGRITIKIHGF